VYSQSRSRDSPGGLFVTITRATLLFAAYTLVTVVLTHPIAWHLAEVPHDVGDPLLSAVVLWWNAHHLPLSQGWLNAPFFFPTTGAVTFSDHRLGESLIASPLQWIGLAPLVAGNVTLLATFPLSALAAHWLAFTLTGRHDAGTVAGLAYGFSPYRFGHIEHLELLAAFGMPVALGALHHYLEDRDRRWLALFTAALLLQALACSYYVLFFAVLLALWIVWFIRVDDIGVSVGAAIGLSAVVLCMTPIGYEYLSVHDHFGLARIYPDIVRLSADVTSIVTGPSASILWGWTSTLNGPERQLFPGAAVLVLVGAAVAAALRSTSSANSRSRAWRLALVAGVVLTVVSAASATLGPWQVGVLRIFRTPYKTFSLAFCALVFAVAASPPARDAFRRRSVLAFYAIAAAVMFLFALGPAPAFLRHQILYQPPYAWLMRLRIFQQGVRVPARFGMLVVLALSTAAALAFARFFRSGRRMTLAAAVIVCSAILADAWIGPVPTFAAPLPWPPQVSTAGVSSALELPLGETIHDVAAMYRTTLTNIPTVNGYSGYFPPHYEPLRLALEERDESALAVLAARGPLLVVVERAWPYARERLAWLRSLQHNDVAPPDSTAGAIPMTEREGLSRLPSAREVASNEAYVWFVVNQPVAPNQIACGAGLLPIVAARDWRREVDLGPITDHNAATFWSSGTSQRTGDALRLDLGHVVRPCSIRLSLGYHGGSYPRALQVTTSIDNDRWETTFDGKAGGMAVAAHLERPRDPVLEFDLQRKPARYVRLQVAMDQPDIAWLITEIAVTASNAE
jgi:hypothetical protein